MKGAFPSDIFGSNPLENVWNTMEDLHSRLERRTGARASRGDVRAAVLALLAEEPMHGYQIINEIAERSGGAWKPSAGSVYPTLQLLADEGAISAEESNGRKTYSLSEAGRKEAEKPGDLPWSTQSAGGASSSDTQTKDHKALPKAGLELAQVAAQVARIGTPDQVEEAVAALTEARKKLYLILAGE